MHVILQYMYEW